MTLAQQPIINPPVPNLPLGPQEYDRLYQDQLNNVFRLFFNQLNNALNVIVNSYTVGTTVYTVATLPSAVTSGKGARSFVTDALAPVFGSTVVTGGAVATPVYSDGTNWKVG
jgi:hypothetical protein